MGKNRKYIISWNNYPNEITIEKLKEKTVNLAAVKYLILSYEIGKKEKTPHIQGYVHFKNPQHFDSVRKLLDNKNGTFGFLQEAYGSDKDNKNYCSKQGNYIEYGELEEKEEKIDKTNQSKEIIEDIINGVDFITICKKYSYYVCYHYKDFKKMFNDLTPLKKYKNYDD